MSDQKNPITGRTTRASSPRDAAINRAQQNFKEAQQNAQSLGKAAWGKARRNVAAVREDVVAVHGLESALYSNPKLAPPDLSTVRTKLGVTLLRRSDDDEQKRAYPTNPAIYTTPKEQSQWKEKFRESGANAFITPSQHDAINATKGDPKNRLPFAQVWGRDHRNFVGTKAQADRAVQTANERVDMAGDSKAAIKSLAETYSTNWDETDKDQTMLQYSVGKDALEHWNLQQPTGAEASAYKSDFIAGGKTRGGALEGTINAVSREDLHSAVQDGSIAISRRNFNRQPGRQVTKYTPEGLAADAAQSTQRASTHQPIAARAAKVRAEVIDESPNVRPSGLKQNSSRGKVRDAIQRAKPT